MERDPFALIEAMTIAAYATGCERGFLYIRGEYPEPQHALEAAIAEARAPRVSRRRRARRGVPLRDRGPQGRRRLHLRRGDGDLRVDRGQPRRAAQQAAVPGGRGALRQADCRQQRRDARQRARHRPPLGPGRTPRRARRDRPERSSSACPGNVERPGVYEVPFGTTLRELLELAGRRRPGARSCSASSWAARRAASCGPTSSTCRSRSRAHAKRRRRSARAS